MLFIFDVDGTLCQSGQPVSDEMAETLRQLSEAGHTLGLIGGGTYQKIYYQMASVWDQFDFACCENGQYTVKGQDVIYHGNLRQKWGTLRLTEITAQLMKINAELELPVKTGKFIDLRDGLLYWTPIGQNCTPEDRADFKTIDQKSQIRQNLIKELQTLSAFENLHISLGGELGIAITPPGWDKSFPYFHQIILTDDYLAQFDQVYCIGDKMGPDGSDAPMKKIPRTICYEVESPKDCQQMILRLIAK